MDKFDDGAHIIYVNGENQADTPLGHLMRDFKQSNPDKLYSKLLADKMRIIKSNSEEDTDMCELMEDFLKEYSKPIIKEAVDREIATAVAKAEVLAEARGEACGFARGELRGKIDAIRSMIINGLITLNDLKASGRYTEEELAAISQ